MADLSFHECIVDVDASEKIVSQSYSFELVEGDRVVEDVRVVVSDATGRVLFEGKTLRGQFEFELNFSLDENAPTLVRVDVEGQEELFEFECELDEGHPAVSDLRKKIEERVRTSQRASGRYPWYKANHRGYGVLPAGEIESRMRNLGVNPNDVFETGVEVLNAMHMPKRLLDASGGAREFQDIHYWESYGFPCTRKMIESIERQFVIAENRGDPAPPSVQIIDPRLNNYGGLGGLFSAAGDLVDIKIGNGLAEELRVSSQLRFEVPEEQRLFRKLPMNTSELLQKSWNEIFPGGKVIPKAPSVSRQWFRLALAKLCSEATNSKLATGFQVSVVPQIKHKRDKVNGTVFTAKKEHVASISPTAFLFHLAGTKVMHGSSLPSGEVLTRSGFIALNAFTETGGMMTVDINRMFIKGVYMDLEHPGNALGIYSALDEATSALFRGFLDECEEELLRDHDAIMDGYRLRAIESERKIEAARLQRSRRGHFITSLAGMLLLAILAGGGTDPKQLEDKNN